MRKFLFLLLIIISCKRKEEPKTHIDFQKRSDWKTENGFQKIDTILEFKYFLAKKIIPDKEYDYWQYATVFDKKGESYTYTIVQESGDTSLRKFVNKEFKLSEDSEIFGTFHSYWPGDRIAKIRNNKVTYLKSISEFRDFLGTIDNLEEALLLAKTYGYVPSGQGKGSEYRKVKDGFKLHLTQFDGIRKEYIEVKVTKDGFLKTKSLGFEKLRR